MSYWLTFRCPDHPTLGSCADYLVAYDAAKKRYGLWVHTGVDGAANSYIEINNCPWCGIVLAGNLKK